MAEVLRGTPRIYGCFELASTSVALSLASASRSRTPFMTLLRSDGTVGDFAAWIVAPATYTPDRDARGRTGCIERG